MSNALAAAAVTAVVRQLLQEFLDAAGVASILGGSVNVTALAPDLLAQAPGDGAPTLNLFLYRVEPNQGWRNAGLPSHDQTGRRVSNPPLALNLHYLVNAYARQPVAAEVLLGHAAQMLHEVPVLSRELLRQVMQPWPAGPDPLLRAAAGSGLADQVETVRFTPEALGSEELSKLWAAFQTNYRPTVAYVASVVLIEGRRQTRQALPVQERKLLVVPFQPPVVERISPDVVEAGDTVVLAGANLKAESTEVVFSGVPVIPAPDKLTDSRIEVNLPPGLRAGVNAASVVQEVRFGTAADPHRGFESNVVAFLLRPRLTAVAVQNPSGRVVNGSIVVDGDIRVQVEPNVGRIQRVTLLLSQFDPLPGLRGRVYGFNAPPGNGFPDPNAEESDIMLLPFAGVVPDNYLVRLRVDGAESSLDETFKLTIGV